MQFNPPLTYIDDDGAEYQYDSVEFLAQDVEFVNDFHQEYKCHDAVGQRFRLVVSAMRLLLLQAVPDNFRVEGLEIREARVGGSNACVEVFANSPLRCLVRQAGPVWEYADPAAVEGAPGRVSGEMSPEKFDSLWVKSAEKI
ncbi:hypothetical protein [Streptomyces sp. NBC_00299]|uniref:hypothetical protein n=1 Tax=Streptomyces sp. NBC_00299 TaxID=2975705 RepID=UPI002E2AE2FD|nr:hypothetical protein [Streptomyces sp. NBC_00299]